MAISIIHILKNVIFYSSNFSNSVHITFTNKRNVMHNNIITDDINIRYIVTMIYMGRALSLPQNILCRKFHYLIKCNLLMCVSTTTKDTIKLLLLVFIVQMICVKCRDTVVKPQTCTFIFALSLSNTCI